MGRPARKAKEEGGDLVQCERCERWCYLDETTFKTVAEAEGNGFVCRLCKMIENLEKQLKSEMARTKEELEKEKTKRAEFEERVEREWASRMEAAERKWSEEREKRQQLEKQLKEMRAREAERDTQQERKEKVAGGSPSGAESGAVTLTWGPRATQVQREETTGGREGEEAGKTQPTETGGRQDLLEDRKVWVVGSSNVSRIQTALLRTVQYDRRVKVECMPGARFEAVAERAKSRLKENSEGRNLVILHAGVNDVLQNRGRMLGRQIQEGVAKLRAASEAVHIALCTVPEIRGQGPFIEEQVVAANVVIRELGRALKCDVVEVNRMIGGKNFPPFGPDGIHYTTPAGWQVGTRVGRRAQAFLQVRRATLQAKT
ncbi:uncharacterized protein [Dermacentor albipictus]|uniref:uncharacterized protein n=1 Tax=Dermacentor albipictus TaxID=60249 RepID=UPI0038FC55F5